uniref:Uncharacterized protein n=1 Tax=Monodelphis domestica TaxID=13616 RepID=A0A5F8GF78_MONDO
MTEVEVKTQPPDAELVEINRIIELCHQFPHGITDQVIQNEMPHIEAQQRAMAINTLLSMGQLDLLRSNTGFLCRIKESQNTGKMKGSDNQEKLVYQIIEDAGKKDNKDKDIGKGTEISNITTAGVCTDKIIVDKQTSTEPDEVPGAHKIMPLRDFAEVTPDSDILQRYTNLFPYKIWIP